VLGEDVPENQIGDRMDNLVHASATIHEAEREIKLWFQPSDIMPYMRVYDTEVCDGHYYYLGGKLLTSHEPGASGILSPGDIAWKSDLDSLRAHLEGTQAPASLDAVIAKYLINRKGEED